MYHLVKLAGLEPALYTGDTSDGKRDGYGTQIFPNGYKYSGQWKKNCAHGKGRLQYTDGTTYEGLFAKNRITEGIVSFCNGTRFAGKFCSDERAKHQFEEGTIVFRNGDIFKGTWNDGIPRAGTYINKSGEARSYDKARDFYDYSDAEGGSGKQILASTEDIYEGGFSNGVAEGVGFLFSSYPHYESFSRLNGKLHGKYVCNYISGGYCYEGTYEAGKRTGKWRYMTVKGYLFEGDADFKHGTVTFPYISDDYYKGEVEIKFQNIAFKNGVYNAKDESGRYTQVHVKNGATVGSLPAKPTHVFCFEQVASKLNNSKISAERPILNGEHSYTYPDGSIYSGNFVCDFIYVHKDDLPRCYAQSRQSDVSLLKHIDIKSVYQYSSKQEMDEDEVRFTGTLVHKKKEGYCEVEYACGTSFKGVYAAGVRSGQGVYTDVNGNAYAGEYVNDELHGPVVVSRPNGDRVHTAADAGVVSYTDVTLLKSNGLQYKGPISGFAKEGHGTLIYTNKYELCSYFTAGEIDTSEEQAVLTAPDGRRFACTYTNAAGRDIGLLECASTGTVYVYSKTKGTLQVAQ